MSYFEEIVLPSVGLPQKQSYTVEEGCHILQINGRSLRRMARKGRLKIVEGQITGKEFEKFFK